MSVSVNPVPYVSIEPVLVSKRQQWLDACETFLLQKKRYVELPVQVRYDRGER